MDFEKVVKERRSVRDYDGNRAISDAELQRLFELVKLSPSSYNLQPWEFIVVRDEENKKRLLGCTNGQKHIEQASATVIALGSMNPSGKAEAIAADRTGKGAMDAAKKEAFFARVKSLTLNEADARLWAVGSTSLAAMTLMLAAENMGISSCPVGNFDERKVKKEFGIPQDYAVVLLITLGYESKPAPERPVRFGYEKIVHLEKFGNNAEG
ncbi:nitroreductase family protein [Candidatus Woesearchaeota archaeon]|nr:nitroreductase family protein [Candidatus Woesearchaeota archaeon]